MVESTLLVLTSLQTAWLVVLETLVSLPWSDLIVTTMEGRRETASTVSVIVWWSVVGRLSLLCRCRGIMLDWLGNVSQH